MDSGDRSLSIVSGFLFIAIVAIVFLMTSCVETENKLDQVVQIECIKQHGDWVVSNNTGKCNAKK